MRVTVLGTGIMGGAMAQRLVDAGHDVTVWNRTREKAGRVAGATVAESADDAVAGAGVVLTMLADGNAVEAVMSGTISTMPDDSLWLQMSTVGDAIDGLVDLAREHDIAIVDAPVLGTRRPAEEGTLTVIAAGTHRDRAATVFDVVGQQTRWVSDEPGAASRLKLVVNGWIVGLLETLAESVESARTLGLDPQDFLDTIDGGPLWAAYAGIKGGMMIEDDYPTSFPLELALKDARLLEDAALRRGLRLPLISVVAGQLASAVDRGEGRLDMAAVIHALDSNQ